MTLLNKKDVYQHIAGNNFKITYLILLFPVLLSAFIYIILHLLLVDNEITRQDINHLFTQILPIIVIVSMVLTLLSMAAGSQMMLHFAGAKPCPKTGDYLRVYRAVENIALAAGVPTPQVYLINDKSLNAFATGYSPKKASIALTVGIVEKLSPLELEAVIAHEMGHIINRDIRLNMFIITGIGILGLVGEILLRLNMGGRRSSDQKGNGLAVVILFVGLGLVLFRLLIAPFLHMAISRAQEYNADATGALLTRNPQALADALAKISSDPIVESLNNSKQMAFVCIYNPLKRVNQLLSTHPPIQERIKRLESM